MEDTIFTTLSNSNDPVVAILSTLVLVLSGIVIWQWRYTNNNTVPKWIWDSLVEKVEKVLDLQKEFDIIIKNKD